MTPLARLLAQRIAGEGPLTMADFMAAALTDPNHGYYTTRDPLGRDFTTAPEISQMFGELIGAWCADLWMRQGRPAPFVLAEIGPGRGTLMADAWRALAQAPGMRGQGRIALIEVSPALRARQAEALRDAPVTWYARAEDLPSLPAFIIANELFDALPIRQFRRSSGGWRERCVGLADEETGLALVERPVAAMAAGEPPLPPANTCAEGAIIEVSPARARLAAVLAAHIRNQGGAALIIDYGYALPGGGMATGDTVQALHNGRPANPLEAPGESDVTAHVDFDALRRAVEKAGAAAHGPVPQGRFLRALGIEMRARVLKRACLARGEAGPAAAIDAALFRLVAPSEMGALTQALAITAPRAAAPAGFEDLRLRAPCG